MNCSISFLKSIKPGPVVKISVMYGASIKIVKAIIISSIKPNFNAKLNPVFSLL